MSLFIHESHFFSICGRRQSSVNNVEMAIYLCGEQDATPSAGWLVFEVRTYRGQ